MSVRIVTDSTCDLPETVAAEQGIRVIPLYIHIGHESYLDGVELSRETFYADLPTFASPPTTAAPGIDVFQQVYDRLADEGATGVISIHIAESLSNTVNVARLAAQGTNSVPVKVVDSGQLSLGLGLEALAAAEVARGGGSLDEVEAAANEMIPRTHTFAALSTVDFLKRSGRLTSLQAGLASFFQIVPLLKMNRGVADMERIRTRKKAQRRLIALVEALGELDQVAIVHTGAQERAAALHEEAQHLLPMGLKPIYGQVTPVIGAHIGPGAVGFVCVARQSL